MRKIYAIIAVLSAVTVFTIAGCQKQEAPKPAEQPVEQSAVTSTVPASAETSTTPTAAPEHK